MHSFERKSALPSQPPRRREPDSQDLADRLRAVERIAESIESPQDLKYLRLEEEMERLPAALREATRRTLLQVRRTARRWNVLSTLGAEEPPRIRSSLREVAESLRQGDLTQKLTLLDVLVTEEVFEAAPVLATRLIVESDPMFAAALARAVGFLGGEAIMVALKQASRHENRDVRLGALEGLRHHSGKEAVRILVERLGDPDPQVQRATLDALGSRPPEAILGILKAIPPGKGTWILRGAVPFLRKWAELPATKQLAETLGVSLEDLTRTPPPITLPPPRS